MITYLHALTAGTAARAARVWRALRGLPCLCDCCTEQAAHDHLSRLVDWSASPDAARYRPRR